MTNTQSTVAVLRLARLDELEDVIAGMAGQDLRLPSLSERDTRLLRERISLALSILREFRGSEFGEGR